MFTSIFGGKKAASEKAPSSPTGQGPVPEAPKTDTSRQGLMAGIAKRTIRAVPRKHRKWLAWGSVLCAAIAFAVSAAFNCAFAVTMGQNQLHHIVYCSLAIACSLGMLLASIALALLPKMAGGYRMAVQGLRLFAFAGALYFGTGFASVTKDASVGEAQTRMQLRDNLVGATTNQNGQTNARNQVRNGGAR